MTRLIIARHGNTFERNDIPRRIGRRSDLPLTQEGRAQAERIGLYLKEKGWYPDVTYASTLSRTQETAAIALKLMGLAQPVYALDIFDEIDYGTDEGKTEAETIARIGADSLAAWEEDGLPPAGWHVDPETIMSNWRGFADHIYEQGDTETILVVTSNGIARFAPCLTGDLAHARKTLGRLKIGTGAVCLLERDAKSENWRITEWNVKPSALCSQ